jgi:hypothetical protein
MTDFEKELLWKSKDSSKLESEENDDTEEARKDEESAIVGRNLRLGV